MDEAAALCKACHAVFDLDGWGLQAARVALAIDANSSWLLKARPIAVFSGLRRDQGGKAEVLDSGGEYLYRSNYALLESIEVATLPWLIVDVSGYMISVGDNLIGSGQ